MSGTARTELLFAGPDVVFRVLQSIIRKASRHDLLRVQTAGPQNSGLLRLGILASSTDEEFRRGLFALLSNGCAKMIVLGVSKEDDVRQRMDFLTSIALSNVCQFAGISTAALLSFIQSHENPTDEASLRAHRERLRYVLEGMDLYAAVRRFSHGGTHDVANQFLAPARMLLEDGVTRDDLRRWMQGCAASKDTWSSFLRMLQALAEDEDVCFGTMGMALKDNAEQLSAFCSEVKHAIDQKAAWQVAGTIMSILTECRRIAGRQPESDDRSNVADAPLPVTAGVANAKDTFRLLVVDDHADTWAAVLVRVAEYLAHRLTARIEVHYSSDVATVRAADRNRDLYEVLPEYDLVLLDIYLGAKRNGITLLKEIRTRCHRIPVLIWTTSTASENPASAAHASGFLFKKYATIAEITEAIGSSLSAGRSQRLWSLPNPFFDYVLRDPRLRETALDITKWSLRYMDCFHATDDFHFRYYNDHGGRHIVGVLNVMEKLLRPFLLDQQYRVLPKNGEKREKELFCLYSAILCHEFGMFPILDTDEPCDATPAALAPYVCSLPASLSSKDFIKNVSKLTKDRQKAYESTVMARRAVHALRSMMMLAANVAGSGWEPRVGRYKRHVPGLDTVLTDLCLNDDDYGLAVAVLVGYHQRLLPLRGNKGSRSQFLRVRYSTPEWKKAKEKLETANEALGESRCDLCELVWLLRKARKTFLPDRIARLRRQCALIRFADALDVDHTRAPADFLLAERDQRRPMQDMEDCKRLVLTTCEIDRGQVSVGFLAPKFDSGMLDPWLDMILAGTKKDANAELDRSQIKSRLEFGSQRFAAAWRAENQRAPRDFVEDASMKDLKECLERVVAGFFVYCRLLADPYKMTANDAEVLAGRMHKWKGAVANAAALLVLYEILDEYCAIVDARLNGVITLNPSLANGGADAAWNVDKRSWPAFLDTALGNAMLARQRRESNS